MDRIEGPEPNEHAESSDSSEDDDHFINDSDSPIPSVHEDDNSEHEVPAFDQRRSPSPLDYIPDSEIPENEALPLQSSPGPAFYLESGTEMDTRADEEVSITAVSQV